MISTVTVPVDKGLDSSLKLGNETQDRVFLLSYTEIEKYWDTGILNLSATKYARAKGVSTDGDGSFYFWLRTPYFMTHTIDGRTRGGAVNLATLAVCPAMWIDLNP